VSVSSLLQYSGLQYVERNLLLLFTSVSDLPLRTVKFCSVLSVLFGVVVHAGCDKQGSLMRGGQCGKRTSTLTAINYCTLDRRNCWSPSNIRRSYSQVFVDNRDFCLPHLHLAPSLWGRSVRKNIAITFGTETPATRPWKKLKKRLLVSTEYTNVTDRRTDRLTPYDGIGCAYA